MGIVIEEREFIYDMDTRNKSFLEVSVILEKLGIKNNKFMLALYDKRLVGIDPYNPELTGVEKGMIITECSRNPWYFLREVVLFPAQGGGVDRYLADRSNMAQSWCITNNIDTWSCKPRQNRATMYTLAIITWKTLFDSYNATSNLNTRFKANSDSNLSKVRRIINLLPDYMYKLRIDNSEKIVHYDNNNSINATSLYRVGIDEDRFKKFIDKKMCDSINFYDDSAFIDGIKKIIATSSKDSRMETTMLRMFVSTRNRESNVEMDIIGSSLMWNEGMYDIPVELIHGMLNQTHYKLMYIEYSWLSIGLTEDWINNQVRIIVDEEVCNSELFLEFSKMERFSFPHRRIPSI